MPLNYYYICMETEGINNVVLEVFELYMVVSYCMYFSAVSLYHTIYFYMKYGSTSFIFMFCRFV